MAQGSVAVIVDLVANEQLESSLSQTELYNKISNATRIFWYEKEFVVLDSMKNVW
jgi:KaiC/GvpD/RAD55 family RecA-like ATPase